MAGGDLLDEARAGARHADDEDRRFRRVAPGCRGGKERRRGELDQIVYLALQRAVIENFTGLCSLLPIKGIGFGKAGKGLVAAPVIVQQHAEGETSGNPIRIRAYE